MSPFIHRTKRRNHHRIIPVHLCSPVVVNSVDIVIDEDDLATEGWQVIWNHNIDHSHSIFEVTRLCDELHIHMIFFDVVTT